MADDTLETAVKGARIDLLGLVLKTGSLMVVTLGLYSFWARTRLRRWLWSSVRPGGMPLEYTGQPLEKLIGFFVAAVLLVFYVQDSQPGENAYGPNPKEAQSPTL